MRILVVANSSLGKALVPFCKEHEVLVVSRADYNISKQSECDKLVQDYKDVDCVVLTQGNMDVDVWNSISVNYTSMVYLITKFYDTMPKGQIIAISSASVNWQSWPGINMSRMVYASTKTALSDFCDNLNRKNIPGEEEKPISIQVFEPNIFASKINNYKSDTSVEEVAQELYSMIKNPRISRLRSLNRNV